MSDLETDRKKGEKKTSKLRKHRKTIMEEEKKTKERKFDLKKNYNTIVKNS